MKSEEPRTRPYLFTSERLGFRAWRTADLEDFHAVNSDPKVMEHFPATLSKAETAAFIERLQQHQLEHGHCYFATEELATGSLIGFIGLAYQGYEAYFTPCVDIGWRLRHSAWGKGYATEGAKACLAYGFNKLGLEEIFAVAVQPNTPSIRVMEKIGMRYDKAFKHPALAAYPALETCVVYRIGKQKG